MAPQAPDSTTSSSAGPTEGPAPAAMRMMCPQCLETFQTDRPASEVSCPHCGSPQVAHPEPSSQDEHPTPPVDPTADTLDGTTPDEARKPSRLDKLRNRDFGGYEIIQEINRGAMGIVYKARQKGLDRIVALKVLIAGEHASEKQIRRFRREAQAIAQLRHSNIVPIHDIGQVDGKHYFTMDFIDGEPLSRLLARKSLATARCLDISESIADAVHTAHEAGVIHRDIKPSNIMIDRSGHVQIMDFGLAKQTNTESKYTQSGTTIGTPAYMPPEQARGDLQAIGPASDVYSIGAVLYEMLTGRPPFSGSNMLDVIIGVLNEDPVPPRKLNPRINRDVQTIVLKAMEKDPARRYSTARALLEDLRRFRSGEAIRARPTGLVGRLWRKARTHKAVALSVATVLLVTAVSAGIIYALWSELDSRQARSEDPAASAARETEATWKEIFAGDPSDPKAKENWRSRKRNYLEYFDNKPQAILGGTEIQIQLPDPFYGNVRMSFTALIAADASEPMISCALIGHQEKAPIIATYGRGRMVIAAAENIERSFSTQRGFDFRDCKALAERSVPPLRPGRSYRVTLERLNMDLRFRVEGADRDEQIVYRNLHFSNWRVKNVDLLLRVPPAGVRYADVHVEQHIPGRSGPMGSADDRFYRGDYNGAQRTYTALLEERSSPETVIQAHHRLGMYHQIKNQHLRALEHYEQALTLYRQAAQAALAAWDGSGSPPQAFPSLEKTIEECGVHELFCLTQLKRYDEVQARLEEYSVLEGLPAGPWSWHYPILGESLLNAGRLDDALSVHALAVHPTAFTRLDEFAVRLGHALVKAERFLEVRSVYERGPTPALAEALAAAVRAGARAGRIDGAFELLEFCRRHFPPEHKGFQKAAIALADACVASKAFIRVRDVHRLFPGSSLVDRYPAAVAAAIQDKRLDQALTLLAYARDHFRRRGALGSVSRDLGQRLLETGRPADVTRLHEAYPDPSLLGAFRRAVRALVRPSQGEPNAAEALRVLAYARDAFVSRDKQLGRLAAALGKHLAGLPEVPQQPGVTDAYAAYPVEDHLPNFRSVLERLIAAGRDGEAIDLYIYVRERMGAASAALTPRCMILLERAKDEQAQAELIARLEQVAAGLQGRPLDQADHLIEMGDAYLVTGRLGEARRAYGEAAALGQPQPGTQSPADLAERSTRAVLRQGALAVVTGAEGAGAQQWSELHRRSRKSSALHQVAAYMLGRAEADAVEAWRKANPGRIIAAEWDFYQGLRLNAAGKGRAARRAYTRAFKALAVPVWPYAIVQPVLAGKIEKAAPSESP